MTAIQTVQHYYDAFNRKDWAGMLALVHDDVLHDTNQGSTRAGIALFREFVDHMDRCYDEHLTDMVLLRSDDPAHADRVAASFTVNGIYKATDTDLPPANGQRYVLPAGAFLTVREGKIARVTTYYNLNHWLEMVGA